MRFLSAGINIFIVMQLTACAVPQSKPVYSMTQSLAKVSTNLSIVECSLGIPMLDSANNSYLDPNGFCMNEINSRMKIGTMTREEFEIDKNRAQNEISQYQQQQVISAENQRELSREDSDRQNTQEVRDAICESKPWGCH
ncbi:hypothetical protein OGY68_19760 [Citrobacter sp. Cpo065]|uniref:hypothetical protein n=1 Tax=Citrobacter sp. Cpo065 TaxID=2985131 RepID=UPI002578E275|nr:hypothetical protein [Citrobacter sp. Cpo065]MDM2855128.1 hypothetical protein [Citrobacter sp. Cpo065]